MQRAEAVQRRGAEAPSSSSAETPADRAARDAEFQQVVARAEVAEAELSVRVHS